MQSRTRIKICGLMSGEDAAKVNRCLPDYAGLVFAPGRHRLSLDEARLVCRRLDGRIRKVGVYVNENPQVIETHIRELALDAVQLHGEENQGDMLKIRDRAAALGRRVEIWKALRLQNREDLSGLSWQGPDAVVLDSYREGVYGGTGRSFDWSLAAGAGECRGAGKPGERGKIILAGGLNAGNVAEAIRMVRPYAVDTSSGVETGGVKDEGKIREFIEAVRGLEHDE